jgi:hypothetical protein
MPVRRSGVAHAGETRDSGFMLRRPSRSFVRAAGAAHARPSGSVDLRTRLVRRTAALATVVAVAAAVAGFLPQRLGTPLTNPVVAGFDVSNDLSVATVHLLDAARMEASGPGERLLVDDDGYLRIPLDFAEAKIPTTVAVNLGDSADAVVRITYFPSEYYSTIGVEAGGTVVLYTTLPRSPNPASAEQTDLDPSESLDVQQQRWNDARYVGAIPSAAEPLEVQLRQLYVQYDRLNDPAVGKLCPDLMTGIDTYWAMSNQSCYVWCSGYARITVAFLRSSGIPARMMGLGAEVRMLPHDILVQSSEAHATLEMWVDDHWQWVGPTFRVLKAVDESGTALSLQGVIGALADPSTRDSLRFTRLDPSTDRWVTLPYAEEDQAFKDDLATYLSADKLISIPNGGRG